MRFTIAISSFLVILSCASENNKLNRNDIRNFSNFSIDFVTGDEVIVLHTMSIFKYEQTIVARKESPNYYYGGLTDSIWLIELDKSQLSFLENFIEMARKQNDTCSLLSTSIDHYRIKIGENEKINIIGNCDWRGIDYDSLERKLFENNFIELHIKRENVADSIIKGFEGSWDVYGWLNGSLIDRNVVLTKTNLKDDKNDGAQRWFFDANKLNGLKESLNLEGHSTSIQIRGSRYRILDIQKNKISLQYLW